MKYNKTIALKILIVATLLTSFVLIPQKKPVLYIIGDSTVRNGDGSGKNGQMGWGSVIAPYFDTTKISIRNHAIGGRSSRTFITEGRWDKIIAELQPGDFVIMQFGHNDSGPLDDTARARGTLKGIGDESKEIFNPKTQKQEIVHTYGWYMCKYVNEAKAKGATAIVCSPIPRNIFKEGKTERSDSSYSGWAKQVATNTLSYFINLNAIVASKYDTLGPQKVKDFFPGDHTHTNEAGAKFNAAAVIEGLQQIPACILNKYVVAVKQ